MPAQTKTPYTKPLGVCAEPSSGSRESPAPNEIGVGEIVTERIVKGAKLMSRAPSTLTLAELSGELDAPPEAIRCVGLKRKAARRRTGRLGKCSSRMAPWGHAGQLGGGRLVPRSCRHLGKLRCRLRVQGGDHKLAFAAQTLSVAEGAQFSVRAISLQPRAVLENGTTRVQPGGGQGHNSKLRPGPPPQGLQ